jgi:hypothetical protein
MHRQVPNCIGDRPTNFTRCLCKNTHSLVPRSPFFSQQLVKLISTRRTFYEV